MMSDLASRPSPSPGPFFASGVVDYDPSETPLVLQAGESVAVAIRLLCVATCVGSAAPGLDSWSNGAAEPYPWQNLVTEFGLSNATVRAVGYVE